MSSQASPGPVDFDLSRGRVGRRAHGADKPGQEGHDERVVLLPLSALEGLEKVAGHEASRQFIRSIGVAFGRRVAAKLGSADGVARASLESFVSALAGEVAVAGWGVLHLERWGKALVLVVEHGPALPSGMVAALLEGAVEAATSREVHGVALTGESQRGGTVRVLIVSAKSAEDARRWIVEGANEGEVLRRLHDAAGKGGGAA